jgi:hypothetical protein
MTRTFPLFFAAAVFAWSQAPGPPSFDAGHVYYVDHPVALAPGLVLTIFGNDLGPAQGCGSQHDAAGAYPKALCNVQVPVGGVPSELLWVQAKQINFRVPEETPDRGTTDLVVIYGARKSSAVTVPLGKEGTTISFEGPLRVGMPVWLKVTAPYKQDAGIRYPFMVFPVSFGCNEVEVRRDGVPLKKFADIGAQAFGGITVIGNPCGGVAFRTEPHFKDRLPLHLQYRFDQPGIYEVRLTMRQRPNERAPYVSPWTKIEILPADPAARRQWLEDKIANAPSDAADLLSDFLPGILGNPDDATLEALRPYLYHPDRLVREYAAAGVTYWPESQAAAKVWEWVRAQGPSDAEVRYLMRAKAFAAAQANELVALSIPYLQSNSAVITLGALRAVAGIALAKDSTVSPEIRARAGDALVSSVEHDMAIDRENANEYVAGLGEVISESAHDKLWEIVNRGGLGRGQALIALTWQNSITDLGKLTQLALESGSRYEFASVPYALHHAYGQAAIPYLKMLLERSELAALRADCARELILAKEPEGFAYAADVIANSTPFRQEMVQFVRDRFPELRSADENVILKFVQARATQ